jgi:hypothetical protein
MPASQAAESATAPGRRRSGAWSIARGLSLALLAALAFLPLVNWIPGGHEADWYGTARCSPPASAPSRNPCRPRTPRTRPGPYPTQRPAASLTRRRPAPILGPVRWYFLLPMAPDRGSRRLHGRSAALSRAERWGKRVPARPALGWVAGLRAVCKPSGLAVDQESCGWRRPALCARPGGFNAQRMAEGLTRAA